MASSFLGLARSGEITSAEGFNECMRFHADTKTYSLLLRWKPLSDNEMLSLTIKLADKKQIIDTLDVGRTNFSLRNFDAIAPTLRTSKTLVNLDLGHNDLGLDGARRISKVLLDNCTLEYVNLEWNKIGTQGLLLIVKALEDNPNSRLSVLDIHSNGITDEGALVCFFQYLFLFFDYLCPVGTFKTPDA